jgi:hypothetical protein
VGKLKGQVHLFLLDEDRQNQLNFVEMNLKEMEDDSTLITITERAEKY